MIRPWLDGNKNQFGVRKLAHVGLLKARIGWQNLRTDEFVDEGPFCVTGTDFQNGEVEWSKSYHVSPERYEIDKNIQLRENDLLITKDGTIGKVAVVRNLPGPATLNSGVFILRSMGEGVHSTFMKWIIQSKVFDDFVTYHSSGSTINHLYQNVFEKFRFPYPALQAQKAIADFLDRETARIDQLIEKKRRLVELVHERQNSEITAEVTGVYSNASFRKPSRSSFIGELPGDWEDAQLKHLVRPGTSITYGIVQAGPEHEGGIPYIRTGDMKGDELPKSGYPHTSPEIEKSYARSRMEKGDLVIAIRATVGKCLRLPDQLVGANLTQGTAKISPGPRMSRDFMLYAIQSAPSQSFFGQSSKGATFKEITLDRLRRLVLPLPPIDQQGRIVERLHQVDAKSKRLRQATQVSTNRLCEFRSALITAAVTGQIEVATWGKQGQTDRRLDRIEEEMSRKEATA